LNSQSDGDLSDFQIIYFLKKLHVLEDDYLRSLQKMTGGLSCPSSQGGEGGGWEGRGDGKIYKELKQVFHPPTFLPSRVPMGKRVGERHFV
jgi:hypothetical protein